VATNRKLRNGDLETLLPYARAIGLYHVFFLIFIAQNFGTDIHLGTRISQLFPLAIWRRYVASSEGVWRGYTCQGFWKL